MLGDREITHDCRGPENTYLHPQFFPCTWRGFPVFQSGEGRNRAVGLNLSRVSAPRKEAPFPCGYEDGDKMPDEPSPQPPRTFLHRAQQSHSSHRPTRLLSWWPALLAPRFPQVAMKAILLSLEHSSVFLSQNFCRV